MNEKGDEETKGEETPVVEPLVTGDGPTVPKREGETVGGKKAKKSAKKGKKSVKKGGKKAKKSAKKGKC
jgi:hypothetical protein